MKKNIYPILLMISLILLIFVVTNSTACTDIRLNYHDQYVVGHNFDWPVKYAYIVVNPAHIQRQSFPFKNNTSSIHWISKYGSITVDLANRNKQVNTKSIVSGINQYGLSASILWLDEAKYPKAPKHPVIGTSDWVQYFLDNAKTVAEAITLAHKIAVQSTNYQGNIVLVHLIIHDVTGHSAVMEYIDGHLKIYEGNDLPIPLLTNDPYKESLLSLKKYKNFGGSLPLPGGHYSPMRFVLGAYFLKTLPTITSNQQAVAYTFDALGYLSQPPGSSWLTGWSIVYDLSNKMVYYRDVDNQQIRWISLNDFDFSTGNSLKALLLNDFLSGNVKKYFHVIHTNNKKKSPSEH